jgi:hypothetical protein
MSGLWILFETTAARGASTCPPPGDPARCYEATFAPDLFDAPNA